MGKQDLLDCFLLIGANSCEVCGKIHLYTGVQKIVISLRKHVSLTTSSKANYFAMACLQYTSVASTTVLTSTSGKPSVVK